MMSDNINFEEDVQTISGDFKNISELANKIIYQQNLIIEIEKKLKIEQEELNRIESVDLPNLMDQFRIKEFTLTDGSMIKIKSFINSSLPAEGAAEKDMAAKLRRLEGLKWLRENDGAAIIKNQIIADVGKDNKEVAQKIKEFAESLAVLVEEKESVNHQTLGAFIREKLKAGAKVPTDTFAIFEGRKAEITSAKVRKK
jgi:hypothetical protein